MKKFMILFFAVILLFVATACLDEAEYVPEVEGPPPAEVDTPEPDLPEESLSAEELGEIIVRAERLRSGLFFPGDFIMQHVGEEQQAQRDWGTTFFYRVLPSSGFETIEDIRDALLQYFSEGEVYALLAGQAAFYEEYDGNLYFHPYKASGAYRFWEEASFRIHEQEGNRTIVEVIVQGIGEGNEFVETWHYTIVENRVAEREFVSWTEGTVAAPEPEEPDEPGEANEPEEAGPGETAIAAGDVMAQMAGNWVAWYEMNPANAILVNLFADGRWESPGPLPTDMDVGGSFVIVREEAGIYHLRLTIEHTCGHPASVHVEIGSEFGSEIQYDAQNDRLGTVFHSGEGSWIEWFRRA